MKLNSQEVEKVAGLARLTLTDEEKERFSHQLSSILAHMDELNQVMTQNVSPTSSLVGDNTVLREDVVKSSLSQEDALLNAPDPYRGFFKVAKILNDR